jgi:hypothetical protein
MLYVVPFVIPFQLHLTPPQKDSSQETIISLLGMIFGTLVVANVTSLAGTWTAMIALLAIHLGMNYFAVRSVSMRTLNRQRANLVFSMLYQKYSDPRDKKGRQGSIRVPGPDDISFRERIFEEDGVLRWDGMEVLGHCEIGVSLRRILDLVAMPSTNTTSYTGINSKGVEKLFDIFEGDEYIMWYDERPSRFLICLKRNSTTETQLYAWMHALFMAMQIQSDTVSGTVVDTIASTKEEFQSWMQKHKVLESLEKAGWDLKTAALETRSGTRIRMKGKDT